MSRLGSSTTTPIRAITSSLSARSSAPVPAASQTYEPLLRAVLRHRLLYGIFLSSAIFNWAQAMLWIGWWRAAGITQLPFLPFLPSTLAFTAFAWALGVVPVVVLRKARLTATRAAASSPSQTFKIATSKTTTFHSLATYVVSAAGITTLHILSTYANEPPNPRGDHHLAVFVRSRKHPYFLNGRFLFLLFSQLTLAIAYFARNTMLDRFAVHWKSAHTQYSKPAAPYTYRLALTSFTALISTGLVLSAYTVAFGLARSLVLPALLGLPWVSRLLRPFCAHFLRGSWTILLLFRNLPLIWRTFFVGFTTLSSWEFAESLFDEKIQEPIHVAQVTPDSSATLISGTTSSDVYFKYFAYHELNEFAKDDSPSAITRRTALFGDQKYSPSLWATLLRESLLFLGNDYQVLLRRGQPAPPTTPAPAPPVLKPAPPSTPLLRKQIFKAPAQSPIRSVIDSIAADGALTQAVQNSVQTTAAHMPELFKGIESPAAAVKQPLALIENEVAVKAITAPVRSISSLKRLLPVTVPLTLSRIREHWENWWRRERVSKTAEASLLYREVDALIVEVLSRLVCASLTEDRYGVVQRDIPRILEAMLSHLMAIEEYQAELSALAPAPSSDEDELSVKDREARDRVLMEVTRAGDVLAVVGDALKEGIVRIVRTFGERLSAFKFPPRIAHKLQGFVDYN